MKALSVLTIIVPWATLVTANGIINVFAEPNCTGATIFGSYMPLERCNGGCVWGWWGSVKEGTYDTDYGANHSCHIFTVYTHQYCMDDTTAMKGDWQSLSEDCGS
ncbi:hypothetical protein F5Y19DRAFT_469404 [Xylariaceae sp. FL1651]|nr:hypothetical protein F5Y19DRAFT_469404 [Xylariaceae sp. FL1651]